MATSSHGELARKPRRGHQESRAWRVGRAMFFAFVLSAVFAYMALQLGKALRFSEVLPTVFACVVFAVAFDRITRALLKASRRGICVTASKPPPQKKHYHIPGQ